MNTPNKPEEKPSRSGARYETCRECKKDWNVSKLAVIHPDGYLCPKCWGKYRGTTNNNNRSKK